LPLLTITPESAVRLLREDAAKWVGVFIDAPDDELDRRIATRGAAATTADLAQRAADREHRGPPMTAVVNDGSLADAVSAVLAAVRG
jgi:ribose 1,5-bisphosphokinase PhnN